MPDKPTTVVAYAAGASLAAIAAFYVFGPTFFIDSENAQNTSDGRKRTIIGLSNPANDCFINSVLQALAGLGDLRLYLIRELHRRQLDGPEIFESVPTILQNGETAGKVVSLQQGPVTRALKDMLNMLNERPIYKKTITARPLIEALEKAFNTRISRNQQDAQEFLQIVLERLCDEYHAAEKARRRLSQRSLKDANEDEEKPDSMNARIRSSTEAKVVGNDGFPFEGRMETQIQCQHCGFRTKPSASTFVSLTLNVPQKASTTLDNCFDVLLKSEEIEDYRCDKCRLRHALEWKQGLLRNARTNEDQEQLGNDIGLIEQAINDDPEKPPEGVALPDLSQAPKRKIRKSTKITLFPKVIAIHLSRSVFEPNSYSTKNIAKVSYTQRLRLGGILNEKWYKLLGVVCHKGSHNSGHYESFRRNHLYPPFATPDAFSAYALASRVSSPAVSARPSQDLTAISQLDSQSKVSLGTSSTSETTSRPSSQPTNGHVVSNHMKKTSNNSLRPAVYRTETQMSRPQIRSHETESRFRRKKKTNDRWWRISDDKIKEARTSDVLGMQREVYLLFYELEREGDSTPS